MKKMAPIRPIEELIDFSYLREDRRDVGGIFVEPLIQFITSEVAASLDNNPVKVNLGVLEKGGLGVKVYISGLGPDCFFEVPFSDMSDAVYDDDKDAKAISERLRALADEIERKHVSRD